MRRIPRLHLASKLVACMLAALSVLASTPASAQEEPPANQAPTPSTTSTPLIVLYTMGQGEVLFEKFGHAALCVEYLDNPRRDRCYNYGTTNFKAPIALGWGFLRGSARFWSSTTTPGRMLDFYQYSDRTIWRQELPLTREQVRAIAAKLEHDVQPDNRYYFYHHFYDNCTTRLRDIIDEATGGLLRKDSDTIVGPSFREFGRTGFAEQKGILVLSDFVAGRAADLHPDLWQAMFLPDYLRQEVHRRLGAEPVLIYERQGRAFSQDEGAVRGWILLLAMLVAAPVAITRILRRRERLGAALAAVPLFLIAFVIWALPLVTSLPELRYNEALLVFWPTDILLPFLRPERRQRYAQVRVAVLTLVSMLAALGVLVQPLWAPILVAFLPLVILAVPARERATAPSPATVQVSPA